VDPHHRTSRASAESARVVSTGAESGSGASVGASSMGGAGFCTGSGLADSAPSPAQPAPVRRTSTKRSGRMGLLRVLPERTTQRGCGSTDAPVDVALPRLRLLDDEAVAVEGVAARPRCGPPHARRRHQPVPFEAVLHLLL